MLFPETCKRLRNASVRKTLDTRVCPAPQRVSAHWCRQRLGAGRPLMQVVALILLFSHWNPIGKISACVKRLPECACAHTYTWDCRWGLSFAALTQLWPARSAFPYALCAREILNCYLPYIYPVVWQAGAANLRTILHAVAPGKSEHFQPLKVKNGLNPSEWIPKGSLFSALVFEARAVVHHTRARCIKFLGKTQIPVLHHPPCALELQVVEHSRRIPEQLICLPSLHPLSLLSAAFFLLICLSKKPYKLSKGFLPESQVLLSREESHESDLELRICKNVLTVNESSQLGFQKSH